MAAAVDIPRERSDTSISGGATRPRGLPQRPSSFRPQRVHTSGAHIRTKLGARRVLDVGGGDSVRA